MKRIICILGALTACLSVMVTVYSVSSKKVADVSVFLNKLEAQAYTPGYVENPGSGTSDRKAMPVKCAGAGKMEYMVYDTGYNNTLKLFLRD